MRIRILTIALAAGLLAPASALAGTATMQNGVFSYTANPGEQNYLIADVTNDCAALGTAPPCFSLSDSANLVLTPPPGCVNWTFSSFALLCPMPERVQIDAGDGNDAVLDWNGPSTINGGAGDDSIFGHGGDDAITGGEGADDLIGGLGNDRIDGGPGSDLLESPIAGYGIAETPSPADSGGSDVLDGGSGLDTVSYQLRLDPLTITLDGRANDGARGENDRIGPSVESVVGGSGNDTLTGSRRSDGLYGYSGNDTLHGGRGDDTLDGGPGNDVVLGEAGADVVAGGHDQDVVDGGRGRDSIYGEYAVGCNGTDACLGGADVIRARDGERDLISCGVGSDRAQIDRIDLVRDIPGSTECERLQIGSRRGHATTTDRVGLGLSNHRS